MQKKSDFDLYGLDISSYQQIINEDKLFYSFPDFIYFRAYGSIHSNMDADFLQNVQTAKKKGVPSGAYFFGTPKKSNDMIGDARQQADLFAKALQAAYGESCGDLIPFLDVEEYTDPITKHVKEPMSSGMTPREFVDWIKNFRDHFYTLTGRRVGLYSNRYFLTDPYQMGISPIMLSELASMPLWLAEYDYWYGGIRGNVQPADLGGWKRWAMWQYAVLYNADTYGLSHSSNEADHNRVTDISWIMKPPAINDFTILDLKGGMLEVAITHPAIPNYLGSSVYVNGEWKAWIPLSADRITIPRLPLRESLEVAICTESYYHDVTKSKSKLIMLT